MNNRSKTIKHLIEESGHSYQELEGLTGIKKSTLQRYASGTTTKIPITAIEKIAKAFNISPRIIMGWDEETQYQLNNNDVLAKIIFKMRKDKKFFEAVKVLNNLNENKLEKATQILALL